MNKKVQRNCIITAHKRSLRRLCFHRCLSVHRGVCGRNTSWAVTPPIHLASYTPLAGTAPTPGRYTPLGRYTSWQVHPPPRQMANKRVVHILLECNLVQFKNEKFQEPIRYRC